MKKTTMIIGLAIVGGLGWAFFHDASRSGVRDLELAIGNSGSAMSCETKDYQGETWALCDASGFPMVWQQRGDRWAAANGKAVRAVRDAGTTTTLIYRDLENPPSVPSGLVE